MIECVPNGTEQMQNRSEVVVSFIVPALNEEANLAPLFERLLAIQQKLAWPSEIVVIDDASEDGTFRVAQQAASVTPTIRVHRKPLPHGLGLAVREGLARADGRVGIVVMADGVDPLEEAVPALCASLLQDGCQLALLSRYALPGDARTIPASYRIFHVAFRFFASWVLGIPYPDTTYAFRGFDVDYVRSLDLRSSGFEISPEITFRTFFSGGKICEVAGRQTRRIRGKSSFRFTRVAPGYLWVAIQGLRLRLRRSPPRG